MGVMQLLDLTLPGEADNLALDEALLDEALLDEAESADPPGETLRLWEPQRPMVVLGRSSNMRGEVHLDVCRQLDVGVFRRASGGAAIVAGPGCLMYALVLSRQHRPLHAPGGAHRYVLNTIAAALRPLAPDVACRGISDLAMGRRKVSGNSIRIKRDHLLYHGTLLYDFPLELVDRCLAMPPRMPDYRDGRSHEAFLTNLPLTAAQIRDALITAWNAREPCNAWPRERTARLVSERYGRMA